MMGALTVIFIVIYNSAMMVFIHLFFSAGVEPRASCMLDKHSATKLCPLYLRWTASWFI